MLGKISAAGAPFAASGVGTVLGLTVIEAVLMAITVLTVCIVVTQAVRPRKAVR
jgi:hypothetical protein